jgi:hypothetical protein
VSTQFLFALRHLPICEIDRRPTRGFTDLMFLCYVLRPTALPRRPDALPVTPSGPEAAGGEAIDNIRDATPARD